MGGVRRERRVEFQARKAGAGSMPALRSIESDWCGEFVEKFEQIFELVGRNPQNRLW